MVPKTWTVVSESWANNSQQFPTKSGIVSGAWFPKLLPTFVGTRHTSGPPRLESLLSVCRESSSVQVLEAKLVQTDPRNEDHEDLPC